MTEGVLVSRSYAAKRGYLVSPDRDLLAFGAANITAGASLSFSVGSSTSRTAAMDQLGSRTQLPSLVLALGAFILLLVGTDLLAQIPSPAIGAVVTVAVLRLLGIGELREIFTQSRYEFAIGLACLIGVLVLGPLGGLFLAFVLALVNLARRASRPEITVLAAAPDADGAPVELVQSEDLPGALSAARPTAIVIRFAAPVFFANGAVLTNRVADVVREAGPGLEAVIIDAEAITDIDVTGVDALREVEDTLGNAGITLAVSRLRPGLKDRLHRFGLLVDVPEFETNREALAALPRPSITSAARPSSGEEQA